MLKAKLLLETVYPSLARQTCQDFEWVVVADALIPSEARTLIETRFSEHQNFHLDTIDPFLAGNLDPNPSALSKKFLGGTENVITSRIDDDDALRYDFISEVQTRLQSAGHQLASLSV